MKGDCAGCCCYCCCCAHYNGYDDDSANCICSTCPPFVDVENGRRIHFRPLEKRGVSCCFHKEETRPGHAAGGVKRHHTDIIVRTAGQGSTKAYEVIASFWAGWTETRITRLLRGASSLSFLPFFSPVDLIRNMFHFSRMNIENS